VTSNFVHDIQRDGIMAYSAGAGTSRENGLLIANNRLRDCGLDYAHAAIGVGGQTAADRCVVIGNIIWHCVAKTTGSGAGGINLQGTGIICSNNQITDVAANGITMNLCFDCNVNGNIIDTTEGYTGGYSPGIELYGGNGNNFNNNNFKSIHDMFIWLVANGGQGCSNNNITGNSGSTAGIFVRVEEAADVSNVIQGNNFYGGGSISDSGTSTVKRYNPN
jgi:hypothetical protein